MSIELLNKCYELDIALKEKQKLQSNWNSLREWLEEQQKEVFHIGDKIGIVDSVSIDVLLDKMNELEGVDNENN